MDVMIDAMTANDATLPCRHGREAVCRLKAQLDAGVVDDCDDDIEWRWRCQSTPDCGIAVFGALEDGCHCLLDFATHLLQRALLADTVPDIPGVARLITLALGARGVPAASGLVVSDLKVRVDGCNLHQR